MQTMYFREGDYNDDINLTVRHGKHWSRRLKVGDEVIFWETGTKMEKRPIMTIVGILYVPFTFLNYLNEWLGILHHSSLDLFEIKDELEGVKPNCTKEKVSLIFFIIKK